MNSRLWLAALVSVMALGALWGQARGQEGGDLWQEPGEQDAQTASPEKVILTTRSFWRIRTVRQSTQVITPDGRIVHGGVVCPGMNSTDIYGWFRGNPEARHLPQDKWQVRQIEPDEVVTLPADTPADWMSGDFDDSAWARARGPVFHGFFSPDDDWQLILMRGRFKVPDPSRAGDLTVSMAIRGGATVYLNGREVGRAFMPEGEVTLQTPALPYPDSAYYDAEGYVLVWDRQTTRRARSQLPQDIKDRVATRTRIVRDIKVPAGQLKKGVNVLAIAVHRAPTPAVYFVGRPRGRNAMTDSKKWTRLGLVGVKLSARVGSTVEPNIGPAEEGLAFTVWNQSIVQRTRVTDYPDPFSDLKPITISAVRNGVFAGQLVVGDSKPIANLKASVSDLSGPGVIPASAVRVRYGRPDGQGGLYDSLEDFAPADVALNEAGRAIQPLWVTVAIPHDAKAGEYRGKIAIAADDVEPVEAELKVRVLDWTLPPAKNFSASMDIIQSPESVAMGYDVALWSDRHFELLDRTFSLLGPLAVRSAYITCIRRTHFGNEHAMVRWVRDDQGELQPDFTVVERYLDTALKHLGSIDSVILYAWEPPNSQGHAGGTGTAGRTHDKPILYSYYDPETGEYTGRNGPVWGTPEAKAFWKKLTDGIAPVLEKRGLKDAMLFGLIGDHRPTKQAMDDITAGVPNARWAMHSHYFAPKWQGYLVHLRVALWGIGCYPTDPSSGYSFGWSNPRWLAYYPREMSLGSALTEHRAKIEAYLGARNNRDPRIHTGDGPRGLGRLGADFWVVVKDSRGRARNTLAGYYPEAAWGQLNLNFGVPRLLGMGRDGAIPTVRSEAFREILQELEARIFVEKALLDPQCEQILGQELTRRCWRTLDERIRVARRSATYRGAGEAEAWYISSGWRERAEAMFALAGEVRAKYGDRDPRPAISGEADDSGGDSEGADDGEGDTGSDE